MAKTDTITVEPPPVNVEDITKQAGIVFDTAREHNMSFEEAERRVLWGGFQRTLALDPDILSRLQVSAGTLDLPEEPLLVADVATPGKTVGLGGVVPLPGAAEFMRKRLDELQRRGSFEVGPLTGFERPTLGSPQASLPTKFAAYATWFGRRLALPIARPIIGILKALTGDALGDISVDVLIESELQKELERVNFDLTFDEGGPEAVAQLAESERGISMRLAGDIAEMIGTMPVIKAIIALAPAFAGGVTARQFAARWGARLADEAGLFGAFRFASSLSQGKDKVEAFADGVVGGVGYFAIGAISKGIGITWEKVLKNRNTAAAVKEAASRLGIKVGASQAQIKTAMARAALRTHPDMRGGSAKEFIKTRKAYDFLIDPANRAGLKAPVKPPVTKPPTAADKILARKDAVAILRAPVITPEQPTRPRMSGAVEGEISPLGTTEAAPAPVQPPAVATTSEEAAAKLTSAVKKGLKKQKVARRKLEADYTKERGKRAVEYTAAEDDFLASGANSEEASNRAKSALGGRLTEERTAPIPELADAEWELMYNQARQTFPGPGLAFSRLNATEAISRMKAGRVLQNAQIDLMENLFGRDLGKTLRRQQPQADRLIRILREIGGTLKVLKAGGDISYSFRQLLPTLFRSPTIWAEAVGKQAVSFFSKKKFEEYQSIIQSDPLFQEAVDHRVPFTDVGPGAARELREESFPAIAAQKIPGAKQSNRAAVMAGNMSRLLLYKKFRANAKRRGSKLTDEKLDKIARLVGNMTGRAVLPRGKAVQEIAIIANDAAFSPRFTIARITNATTFFGTISQDSDIRREGIRTLAGAIGSLVLVTATAEWYGMDVELDPRSADFLKIKIGNTRFDMTGGLGTIYRFIVRTALGETQTAAGEIKDIDRGEAIWQFIRSSRSPLLAMITKLYTGETFFGEEISSVKDWSIEAINTFLFLWVEDAVDAYADARESQEIIPSLSQAAKAGGAAWVGIGVQTYPERAATTKTKFQNSIAENTHKKKWNELSNRQQVLLERQFLDDFTELDRRIAVQRAETVSQEFISRAAETAIEIGQDVTGRLEGPVEAALDEAKKESGFRLTIEREAAGLILNDERFARFQELFIQSLNERLGQRISQPEWATLTRERKLAIIESLVSFAKGRASANINREIERAGP